ncbi:hypothetical protein NYR30_12885 [Gallibacterium salpingitidis]|uniref:hypothetical protein n=1 Tax=Gallibacterium salpingitidis TaxID=505341 RepID=UPI00266E94E2|nr:hypothetical protein [Gallibacterium salpingitidis]WKS99583.1 hypothetical protein NYR30_12885 [Gallibacterium salpingitidis]
MLNLPLHQVIGWRLQREHNTNLVVEALNHVILMTTRTDGMIFHSDQMSIYRSYPFTQCVKRHGLAPTLAKQSIKDR